MLSCVWISFIVWLLMIGGSLRHIVNIFSYSFRKALLFITTSRSPMLLTVFCSFYRKTIILIILIEKIYKLSKLKITLVISSLYHRINKALGNKLIAVSIIINQK